MEGKGQKLFQDIYLFEGEKEYDVYLEAYTHETQMWG